MNVEIIFLVEMHSSIILCFLYSLPRLHFEKGVRGQSAHFITDSEIFDTKFIKKTFIWISDAHLTLPSLPVLRSHGLKYLFILG